MNFNDARQKLLDDFDAYTSIVRGILADHTVTNEDYKPLKDAITGAMKTVGRILRLNEMELSLQEKPSGTHKIGGTS